MNSAERVFLVVSLFCPTKESTCTRVCKERIGALRSNFCVRRDLAPLPRATWLKCARLHDTAQVTMWVGSVLFAIVLSEVEGFVSRYNQDTYARKINVDDVASFLKKESVPRDLQIDIIEWIDTSHCVERERLEQQEIMKRLPPDLQERLVLHLTESLFEALPVLTTIPANERNEFLALLSRGASFTLVRKNTIIATTKELLDGRMFVVVSGRVRMTSAGKDHNYLGADIKDPLLVRGDFFGSFDVLEPPQIGEVCPLLPCFTFVRHLILSHLQTI